MDSAARAASACSPTVTGTVRPISSTSTSTWITAVPGGTSVHRREVNSENRQPRATIRSAPRTAASAAGCAP